MTLQRKISVWFYVLCDYASAVLAWYLFYVFRKTVIEERPLSGLHPFTDNNFWVALLIVPELWVFFYYLTGSYTDLYKKSRLQELGKTLLVSFFGTIIIFFLLLLDDRVRKYSDYYVTFFVLMFLQGSITSLFRMMILNKAKQHIRNGLVSFGTLMVGNSNKANELYTKLKNQQHDFGFRFTGHIGINGAAANALTIETKDLGRLENLESVLLVHPEIEEVIIAIETSEHHQLNDIINRLADKNVTIRIIPDMFDILSGTVRMNHVIGEGFIEIRSELLHEWQKITKRWFDVIASIAAILITLPVTIFVAYRIWKTDRGPVFYTQERLGLHGKPFGIYKFRSMYMNAESNGPQLTTEDDPRITPIGKIIRKYRIDELPQFINVLKGEMSIVGPRAERRYFADKIIEKAPYYRHVFRVQPGITSLGMVKYGYASSVEEMISRLKYDIIYIENMSVMMDFKIMIYTVQTVLYGRGK